MPQMIYVQGVRAGGAAVIPCANGDSAFRMAPTADSLSAYSIAQLVLATGCGITDVIRNIDAGTWVCPQFGVLCTHVAQKRAA